MRGVTLLWAAATGLVLGGLLHPPVPAGPEADLDDRQWVWSHWLLTAAQLAAAAAFAALPWTRAAVARALLCLGFALGALGTLSAATAFPAAGPAPAIDAWTLGLGRLCMLVAGVGAVALVARPPAPSDAGTPLVPRWLRLATLLAGAAAVAAALLVPSSHPWFHDVVLRAGAVGAGLLLAGLAWCARKDR